MSKDVPKQMDEERRQAFIRMLDQVAAEYFKFYHTPEGREWNDRANTFLERLDAARKIREAPPAPVLTDNELKALYFVRSEQRKGCMPTVREVAKAVGLRSSRSGAILVRSLKGKGVIEELPSRNSSIS